MRKSVALELAILGLLKDAPMHGYELRKHLNHLLGGLRAVSFGALYPALKSMTDIGYIDQTGSPTAPGPALNTKRARITYALTPAGASHLEHLLQESGPETWDDEGFGVRFAFFSNTEAQVRRRILEGRRSRLAERRAALRESLTARRDRLDKYTSELQRHGLESIDRELRWIDDLLDEEQQPDRETAGR